MLKRIKPSILFSILLLLQLFIFSPIDIYITNKSSSIDIATLFYSAILFIAPTTIVLLLIPRLIKTKRLKFITPIIGALYFIFFLNSTFLSGYYGVIDGRGLEIESLSMVSILQIIVAAIILTYFFRARNLDQAKIFALVFFSISTITALTNIGFFIKDGGSLSSQRTQGFGKEILAFSQEKNVIHIILDELQSDVTEEVLKSKKFSAPLKGFTFYPDTTSIYPTTIMSLPSMFTGEVYRNETSKEDFINALIAKGKTLPLALENVGFRVAMHGGCQNDNIFTSCSVNSEYALLNTRAIPLDYLQLLDISLFKASPDLLKPYIYNDESWLIQRLFSNEVYTKSSFVGLAHLLMNDFTKRLYVEIDSKPSYKVFHSTITHSPIWLDADCNELAKPAKNTLENKVEEAKCAFQSVEKLLTKIKTLGIYDQSMIIISSDHGSNYLPPSSGKKFKSRKIPYPQASSTLLIKPFSSGNQPLEFDHYPSSLIDIPAVITHATGATFIGTGVDLLSEHREQDRDRVYHHYKWSAGDIKRSTLPPLISYSITNNSKVPSSWHLENIDFIEVFLHGKQLATQVGVVTGQYLNNKPGSRKSGFLSYGPYLTVPPGHYTFQLKYSSASKELHTGSWDITSDGGKTTLAKGDIATTNNLTKALTKEIVIKKVHYNVEFRVYDNATGEISIKSLSVKHSKPPYISPTNAPLD
ncbi:hypothetical protein SIN8267_02126 [Sinobacterium norvegicum]|uniref:Sulfatase N-terminal domain-containing protein n=1 Tax=Sinobacterium norvegicum TaxID=1641715 RepID=A0ABM9AFN7_9GAMM|nr:sulfatase-like hydrolase/transferase [Sinobacterium norvegicum]CAH0992011.1 hypothetical protein SIN8267_02126 [Sinobacterium norvegicum]